MPKLAIPLSDIQTRNAKPKDKKYKLSDGGGLFLQIEPTGAKYWRMAYRFQGKEKLLAFGKYPEITLSDARHKRAAARKLLNEGIDPSQEKKEKVRISVERNANTFERLARAWHANRITTWHTSTAKDTIRRLEIDIFPAIGSLPIQDITHQQLINALKKIELRGAHEVAHRVKATCARIFSYANQLGLENKNPAADLKDVLKPVKAGHFAAITPSELPDFLRAMHDSDNRLYAPTRIAMRLMLLLFLRTSELIETPWSEVDLKNGEWIVPWHRMKRGKLTVNPDKSDHHVCLSRQAIKLLEALHEITGRSKYMFPNLRDHEKPMSNGAILMALKRMGYQGRMTGHGFRALAMTTIKEQLGYRHEVVDRQLAHAPKDKVERAYDRAAFIEERKKMMQAWADYLDQISVNAEVRVSKFRAPVKKSNLKT